MKHVIKRETCCWSRFAPHMWNVNVFMAEKRPLTMHNSLSRFVQTLMDRDNLNRIETFELRPGSMQLGCRVRPLCRFLLTRSTIARPTLPHPPPHNQKTKFIHFWFCALSMSAFLLTSVTNLDSGIALLLDHLGRSPLHHVIRSGRIWPRKKFTLSLRRHKRQNRSCERVESIFPASARLLLCVLQSIWSNDACSARWSTLGRNAGDRRWSPDWTSQGALEELGYHTNHKIFFTSLEEITQKATEILFFEKKKTSFTFLWQKIVVECQLLRKKARSVDFFCFTLNQLCNQSLQQITSELGSLNHY